MTVNDLQRLRSVAERYDAALSDNGHCGEGTFEYRQRRTERDAAYIAFREAFDPLTVLGLLDNIKPTEEAGS